MYIIFTAFYLTLVIIRWELVFAIILNINFNNNDNAINNWLIYSTKIFKMSDEWNIYSTMSIS